MLGKFVFRKKIRIEAVIGISSNGRGKRISKRGATFGFQFFLEKTRLTDKYI
jgi:hypothetical protein